MKKKQEKSTKEERFDISIDIKIENDIDYLINPISPHEIHRSMNQTEETQLATYIAEALDDRDAMYLHLKYARNNPAEVLMRILKYVLAKPRKEITGSRARYYNFLVKNYERTGNYPRP